MSEELLANDGVGLRLRVLVGVGATFLSCPGRTVESFKWAVLKGIPVLLFSGEVISSLQDLQSLSVDSSAEKEKQKAEVKHILQQKQRALADLFKMLAEIGESLQRLFTQRRRCSVKVV